MVYLKGHLKKWIGSAGLENALRAVEYVVANWRAFMNRYQVAADYPDLRLIYGYRRSIAMDMSQKPKWGARWREEKEDAAKGLQEAYGVEAKLALF